MTFDDIRAAAKPLLGGNCKACPVCNGMACRDVIPGPGAKGDVAVRAPASELVLLLWIL